MGASSTADHGMSLALCFLQFVLPVGASQDAGVRAGLCGYSSMVELQPSKLIMRVRFPLPAP